jgi:hypothetical protein
MGGINHKKYQQKFQQTINSWRQNSKNIKYVLPDRLKEGKTHKNKQQKTWQSNIHHFTTGKIMRKYHTHLFIYKWISGYHEHEALL